MACEMWAWREMKLMGEREKDWENEKIKEREREQRSQLFIQCFKFNKLKVDIRVVKRSDFDETINITQIEFKM